MIRILLFVMSLLLTVHSSSLCFSATENLDEAFIRKARQSWAPEGFRDLLEDNGDNYIWQPETLCYFDVTYGAEVWKMTSTDGDVQFFHDSLGQSPWSADGKRMAFQSSRETGAYTKVPSNLTQDTAVLSRAKEWMVVDTDGTKMRVIVDGVKREAWSGSNGPFWTWSPTEPDVSYDFSSTKHGQTSNVYTLYKGTINDASDSRIALQVFPSTYGIISVNKTMSHDGLTLMAMNETWIYPYDIAGDDFVVGTTDFTSGFTTDRPHGADAGEKTYWGNTQEDWSGNLHGFGLDGVFGNQWFHIQDNLGGDVWRFSLIGSASDGSGDYTHDILWDSTNKYTWLNTDSTFDEGGPMITISGNDPWVDAISEGAGYDDMASPSHTVYDRWGTKAFFNSTDLSSKPSLYDLETKTFDGQWPTGYLHGTNRAWSDIAVCSYNNATSTNFEDVKIKVLSYDDFASDTDLVVPHTLYNNTPSGEYAGATYEYSSLSRPSLSPDGTKIGYQSTFLNTKVGTYDNKPDIYYVVAYYPHPPQIIATANGVVRFDWQTDQATTRGYTDRGWPDETTDVPPPPRETEKFRLWKQNSCSGDWSPVTTVNANIFTKYDFADGTWDGVKYWDVTDPSPSGSDCYSVSAVEWSGLESRVKSNVFSDATDAQTVAYPADPKAATGIISSYDANIKRYYNIYALDGSTPTAIQNRRISSIPVASGESFIDVFGKTDGTTQYLVTAVDTQGNESGALISSSTHKESPAITDGQYTLSWTPEFQVKYGSTFQGTGNTFPGTGSFTTQ